MTNNESVAKYHSKLADIKIRFPAADICGIDYIALMKERAKELGFTIQRGSGKGQGSVNSYILSLIEQDLNIPIKRVSSIGHNNE